jgi:hypothetical protein
VHSDLAVLLENKSKSSALDMCEEARHERRRIERCHEDEHCLESIFVVVFWSLTLHNVSLR